MPTTHSSATAHQAASASHHLCPNCLAPVAGHPANGCLLEVLITTLGERMTMTDHQLASLHANVDASALWDDMRPILDKLESGGYAAAPSN